jgi:hypothetical protein
MSTEEGGFGGELASNLKRPDLISHRQAVAALDLNGGSAERSQLGGPGCEQANQLIVGGRTSRCDGDADAASVIGLAGHPSREFAGSITSENQMAVRVDEAWDHRTTADIDHGVGGGRLRRGPDPDDQLVLHDQRSIQQNAQPVRPRAVTGHQFADSGDHRAAHRASS